MTRERLIVAGAFLIKHEHILLALRHADLPDGGHWALIGGKVGLGESIHQGLQREIYEEIGITVHVEAMQLIHVVSLKRDNGTEIISFDFLISSWDGDPINKEPEKHVDLAWFSLQEMPDAMLERQKRAFELYQQGINYSSYGW